MDDQTQQHEGDANNLNDPGPGREDVSQEVHSLDTMATQEPQDEADAQARHDARIAAEHAPTPEDPMIGDSAPDQQAEPEPEPITVDDRGHRIG